jgi:hypothetical protein
LAFVIPFVITFNFHRIMKNLFTLSLSMVAAMGVCSASPLVIVAPASHSAPREIVAVAASTTPEVTAVAPSTAPAVTAAAPAALKASDIKIPLGNTGKTVNLQELSTMKIADMEKVTGKKMGLLQRVEVRLAQRKLRHSINADGTIKNKQLAMMTRKDFDGTEGFHLGGFALGLFLFLIGVLIAYLINDGKKSNRIKWAWIGAGVVLVIILLASL